MGISAVALGGITEDNGNDLGAPGKYLKISGISNIPDARDYYALMLSLVRDGYLSTTKIVGMRIKDGNASRMFTTAGAIKDNFAGISSNLTKLHLQGWGTVPQGDNQSLVEIRIADSAWEAIKARGGILTTSDVIFREYEKETPYDALSFIEKGAYICTLANLSEDLRRSFTISTVIMRGNGLIRVNDIMRRLRIFGNENEKGPRQPYGGYVYLDTNFNLGDLMRVMPANLSKYDADRIGDKIVHYDNGKGALYVPVAYFNGYTGEQFIHDLKGALSHNETSDTRLDNRVYSRISKEG